MPSGQQAVKTVTAPGPPEEEDMIAEAAGDGCGLTAGDGDGLAAGDGDGLTGDETADDEGGIAEAGDDAGTAAAEDDDADTADALTAEGNAAGWQQRSEKTINGAALPNESV
jgi:hypothetical protein